MGMFHEEMVESEPTHGHFGKAIAHTQAALEPKFEKSSLPFLKTGISPATIKTRLENMTKRNT